MPTVDDVVGAYIKLRDEKDAIKKRQSEELKPVNAKMAKLEGWLLQKLNEDGAEKIGTEHGTAYKSTRSSTKVEDWETIRDFILSHDLLHMLERRVAKSAVEEYLEANGELPPGVSMSRETVVNVRRS